MIVEGINHSVINFTDVKWTNKALLDSYDFMESDLTNYSNRLRILADKTYDFGSFPIFISQHTRIYRLSPIGVVGRLETAKNHDYVYNGVDYYFMMKKLDSVTKSIANEKKALFIDLSSNTEWCDNDFYDWCHNTPQGCQKVGSHICKSIEHLLK